MSPGGHLVTTAAACAVAAVATQSPSLVAGVAVGGFLIDVDHVADYVLFEGQRDLRPSAFLRYYLSGRPRHLVLALHSYELLLGLGLLAWWLALPALWGYLAGAVMHLCLDLAFNGPLTPRSIMAFYSFAYRSAHRFDTVRLTGSPALQEPTGFWSGFFSGARLQEQGTSPATNVLDCYENARPGSGG